LGFEFKKSGYISETDPVSEMWYSSEHQTMGKVQKLSNPKDSVHYFLILVFKSNTYTTQHTPDTKACCMEKKLKECVRNNM
jgi:hypothetical protein